MEQVNAEISDLIKKYHNKSGRFYTPEKKLTLQPPSITIGDGKIHVLTFKWIW